MPDSVVIIGAGINGLVAANYLRRAGCEVTVIDRADAPRRCLRLGGRRHRRPAATVCTRRVGPRPHAGLRLPGDGTRPAHSRPTSPPNPSASTSPTPQSRRGSTGIPFSCNRSSPTAGASAATSPAFAPMKRRSSPTSRTAIAEPSPRPSPKPKHGSATSSRDAGSAAAPPTSSITTSPASRRRSTWR